MAAESIELLVFGFVKEFVTVAVPNDILLLLVVWLRIKDVIDETNSDKGIYVETIDGDNPYQKISRKNLDWRGKKAYISALGTDIIEKGQTQTWKFKILSNDPSFVIGIIDNNNISLREVIGRFYYKELNGYALSTSSGLKYHGATIGERFEYAQQFKIELNYLITLTLDLSQEENAKGIVKYIIEPPKKDQRFDVKMDGEHTNIAFDKVDIDKQYRLAVAFWYHKKEEIALLPTYY